MKTLIIVLSLLPAGLMAQEKRQNKETIQRTFPAPKSLGVANISGSVHVIGYTGQQIQLTAVRTVEADTQDLVDKGVKEITLITEEKDGMLQIYPDGPFRESRSHSPFEHSDYHNPGYHFSFEITVRVPNAMDLDLRNINKGGITVEDVHGHFKVHEVNGPVEMKGIGGEGDVGSVNGAVHVAFNQNPTGPCKFRTVNGKVEVDLKPGLSADLEYKTLHGGVYTDFDLNASPSPVSGTTERKDGRFVYRSHGYSRGRVGAGGPLLSFETVNGEVQILRK
jgi:hypothetical protein